MAQKKTKLPLYIMIYRDKKYLLLEKDSRCVMGYAREATKKTNDAIAEPSH